MRQAWALIEAAARKLGASFLPRKGGGGNCGQLWSCLAALTLASGLAQAQDVSPFAPAAQPKPKILRLLAGANAFDPAIFEAFERESGYSVAYDAYADAASLAAKLRDGPYDLMLLPGPALAKAIAGGALQKLDRKAAPSAKLISPMLLLKLSAYDPSGAYSLPADWSADGLIFDADKATARLGAPPISWSALFAPANSAKMRECGIALPNQRDALFIAAWRYLNFDLTRLREIDVKAAADVLLRLRPLAKYFLVDSAARLLASKAACIDIGEASMARFASKASAEAGAPLDVRFAIPREGGPMSLDAFGVPRDAPEPTQALALMTYLSRPDISAQSASRAGVVSALAGGQDATLKMLWPTGAFDAALEALVAREWERVRAGLAKPGKPIKPIKPTKPGKKEPTRQ